MALDFCIKNNHDIVIHKISISLDDFYDMIEVAKNFNPPLVLIDRLKDYYEDAEFFTSELNELKEQFLQVYKKSDEKLKIIQKLILLCDLAMLYNTSINVISD